MVLKENEDYFAFNYLCGMNGYIIGMSKILKFIILN